MTSSSFLLEIGGKRERVSVKKTAELLKMTDAEVQTLAADVLARIDEPFTKISEESGVLKRTKVLTEQARLKVGYLEEELMAWDCTTDRFYLVRKSTATRKMSVQCYSSAGKLVNERAIDADDVAVKSPVHRDAGDAEILQPAQRLHAVVGVCGDLQGADGITFRSCFCHIVLLRYLTSGRGTPRCPVPKIVPIVLFVYLTPNSSFS